MKNRYTQNMLYLSMLYKAMCLEDVGKMANNVNLHNNYYDPDHKKTC